ncbi:MAG: TldD/PmbA family protein [Pseudomonadota bacterium]
MSAENELRLAEALLEAARQAGAEAADAMVVAATAVGVGVAEGVLEEAERAEGVDLGLRVLIGQRQACVSSSDPRPATIAEMAARAVAIAREAPEDPYCGLAEPDQLGIAAEAAALDLVDPAEPLDPAALEALALEAEAAALAITGVRQVDQASASFSHDRVTLVATNGLTSTTECTATGLGLSVIAGEGLGRERGFAYERRRHRADLPTPEWIGTRAGERAVAALGPKKPKPGRYPVLYDERVAASLIAHLLSAINGAAVARGASWLAEAMETQVLPTGLSLIEDPLIPRGLASRRHDAEGFAALKRALVEDGVLKSWVLDLATARQLGLKTTGNARRGPGGPPSPGTTNVALSQGAESRDALIAAMGTGMIVTSMLGASINPTTGSYSRGASGFWVEGGEIVHPVNEITIAGSLPEMMRTLVAADDADPNRALKVPSLLVEGLTIGA